MARLPDDLRALEPLRSLLAPQDLARAERFRFDEDKARFVLARMILLRCLNEFFGMPASSVEFEYNPAGRPVLRELPEIQFSISHTGELAAVAISINTLVGIDLEKMDSKIDRAGLAERIFNQEDFEQFGALPEAQKTQAFFQAWTAKEAWLKARGVGIAEGLEHASVPLEGSFLPQRVTGLPGETWLLQGLPVPPGYCGNVIWNDPSQILDFAWMEF